MNEFKYVQKGDGVYYVEEEVAAVESAHIDFLKEAVERTEKGRARLCLHSGEDDALHEMLIVLRQGGYIRPHRHHNKPESLHVIEGEAEIVLFSETGEPVRRFTCAASPGEFPFFYRISEPVYHTQLVRTPYFIFHETTRGPFRREETEYARWAPPEEDLEAREEYLRQLEERIKGIAEDGI